MGGCGSSAKNEVAASAPAGPIQYSGKGEGPRKFTKPKNPNVKVPPIVYLFGGKKILQFDTKTRKITNLPTEPKVIPPERTESEYLEDMDKIFTIGGMKDGKISNITYFWDPKDWTKTERVPDFPVPIRYTTSAYYDGYIYTIGGETEGTFPENMLKDVYRLKLKPEVGTEWEKFAEMQNRRRSANVMVANGIIHVFGGLSEGGSGPVRTTAIDMIDTKTKECKQDKVRLPLGVEGARMCWAGDDILLIGGKRDGDKPDANVLVLDFEKHAIMSMR